MKQRSTHQQICLPRSRLIESNNQIYWPILGNDVINLEAITQSVQKKLESPFSLSTLGRSDKVLLNHMVVMATFVIFYYPLHWLRSEENQFADSTARFIFLSLALQGSLTFGCLAVHKQTVYFLYTHILLILSNFSHEQVHCLVSTH